MSVPQLNLLSLLAQAGNFNTVRNPDGSQGPLSVAQHGDLLFSELHGRRFHKASRGNLFWGTSGAGGASLLAPGGSGANSGSFILYNPAGSGKYLDVEQFRIAGASTETSVIAGLALEASIQLPTAIPAVGTISQMPLGAGAIAAPTASAPSAGRIAVGKAGTAPTITAMTFLGGLGLTIQATTSPLAVGLIDFDGSLVLAPGMAINFVSTITQSTNFAICDVLWSEFLP